jgi:hypothetical protein
MSPIRTASMRARGARDEALKSGAGSCAWAGRWSSANSAVPASGARCSESSGPHFQSDADLSRIVFGEVNAGLFKSLLYFEDSRLHAAGPRARHVSPAAAPLNQLLRCAFGSARTFRISSSGPFLFCGLLRTTGADHFLNGRG